MRLYKIEITSVPAECDEIHEIQVGSYVTNHRNWKPEGWDEHVAYCAEQGELWAMNCTYFFWPSTDKFYRSRSSAQEKVAIVERWGGEARILEAEVGAFVPTTEENAIRKHNRTTARARKLREQGYALQARADAELRRVIPTEDVPF